ncbi:MAG: hypothetical protein COA79_25035 [Planctomycetota bacterium]|nr:MAG: hypothetical protein COA79_25035 [Planctomycetota bacterium]
MNIIFSNPAFLYFIPLITVPFILHLISRDLPSKLFFPAIRFIKVGKIPVNEKRKLRDILLMLARVLIILAIILICSDPSFKKETANINKRAVVIFDTSIAAFHKSYMNKINEKLSEIEINQNQSVLFIESSNHIKSDKTNADINLNSFYNTLQPSQESPNHYDAFVKASEFLNDQKGTIYIVSNFDIHGFEQINKQLFHPETKITFIEIPLSAQNKTLVSALATTSQKNKNNSTRISIKINNNNHSEEKTTVKIFSTKLLDEKEVSLKIGETDVVIFDLEIEAGTPLMVTIPNDDFSPDNNYFLRSPNLATIDILLISDPNSPIESLFFSEALNVSSQNQSQNMNIMNETPKKLFLSNYESLDFIIISGCAYQLNDRQLTNIFKRYKAGAHLILTPGKLFRKNLSKLNEYGLIAQTPIKKIGGEYDITPYFITNIKIDSSWLKIFKKTSNDFLSIPIKQYIKLRSSQSSEVLLEVENHDPFLVINRQNSGISFLFSINLIPAWSDLPITPIFLPLLHQIITVTYSDTHKSQIKAMTPGSSYKLVENEELLVYQGLESSKITSSKDPFIKLTTPGCYYNLSSTLNVNSSRDHSNPDILSKFEFISQVKHNKIKKTIQNSDSIDNKMWANLCYLLLLLFAIETILHGLKPKLNMHTNLEEN